MAEETFFLNQTEQVYKYFKKWLFSISEASTSDSLDKTIFCQLYEKFHKKEIESGKSQIKSYHNCIGCNLEEGCLIIYNFLKNYSGTTNIVSYLTIYNLLFYMQAERLAEIYCDLGFKKGENFDWEEFPNLRNIKHWANLFKHPKSYMYLHHPSYYIDTDPNKPNFMVNGVIDSNFVNTYWKASPKNNEELHNILVNQKGYSVIYPDLIQQTKIMCKEFETIIEIIIKEDNLEKLRQYKIAEFV